MTNVICVSLSALCLNQMTATELPPDVTKLPVAPVKPEPVTTTV